MTRRTRISALMLAQAVHDAAQAPGPVGEAACAGLSGSADSGRGGVALLVGSDFGMVCRCRAEGIDAYCDANGNGFIDPGERAPDNRVWDFRDSGEFPVIRCNFEAGYPSGDTDSMGNM